MSSSKFDALALDVDKTFRMPIRHHVTNAILLTPDGREGYIEGYLSDSAIAQKHRRRITTDRLSMRNRNKMTGERVETEGVELLAALTTGWLLVSPKGELIDVPHSEQNARELFADHRMLWLREQWDEFTSDRENLSRASSAS